jgi:hypothetical protein
MNKKQKFALILCLWAIAIPTILTEVIAYSVSFQDTFFYADYYIADFIATNGYIPNSFALNGKFWGKVGARSRQPLLPIFMAMGRSLTGLPYYVFRSHLPLVSIVGLVFYVLSKQFFSRKIAISIAFGAGIIAPYMGANSSGFRSAKYIVYFLIIFIFVKQVSASTRFQKRSVVLIPPLLIHLLYNKPRLFIISAFFVLSMSVIILVSSRQYLHIASLGVVGLGFWIILATPFKAYTTFGLIAFSELIGGGIIETQSGPRAAHLLRASPFGFPLFLPVTFIFGTIGGFLTIRWGVNALRERILTKYLIVLAWGLSMVFFVGFQLLTGEIWLLYRSLGDIFPIMILGAGIAIQRIYSVSVPSLEVKKCFVVAILLILLLTPLTVSFVLEGVASPVRSVHSYDQHDMEARAWSSAYIPTNKRVLSDMQHSALLVRQPPTGVYPLSEATVDSVFYDGQLSQAPDHSYLWVDEEMVGTGLYIAPYPREPIDKDQYSRWKQTGNLVYSTGDSSIIYKQ